MPTFKWTCPFCAMPQVVTSAQVENGQVDLRIEGQAEGPLILGAKAIGCSNADCQKTTVHVRVGPGVVSSGYYVQNLNAPALFEQDVHPQGSAKPQPDYVPHVIREDYYEACLIRDLSPKASATLTRRCLQGMIRDFAGIKKARLVDEIDGLRAAVEDGTADRAVTPETVDAIDHVRGIGNIGAHMEKDIDLIVPVDPGEAQALIELIEMLFDEWYGARERRKLRLSRIESIAVQKKELKSASKGEVAATDVAGPFSELVAEDPIEE